MKTKRFGVLFPLVALALLVACQSAEVTVSAEEAISKNPAGSSIDSQAWELKTFLSVSGTMESRVPKSEAYFKINEGKITGNAGANNFFGEVKLEDSSIGVSAVGSTMMMGTPELMAQEGQMLKLLGEAAEYQIVGGELRIQNAEGKTTLTFNPRVEISLTAVEWNTTGINNGRGGVTSLVAGSKVTIEFGEGGAVSGSAGCNQFSGSCEVEGAAVTFGPMRTTRMMCSEPAGVMEQEANFLRALERVATFRIEGTRLELRDAEGALQIRFAAEK